MNYFFIHILKKDLRKANVKSIYLGHFHWWDGTKHLKIAKKYKPKEGKDHYRAIT